MTIGRALELGHTEVPPPPPWCEFTTAGGATPIARLGTLAGGYEVRVPFMDMTRYLPWLHTQANRAGVALITQVVCDFGEVFAHGFDVIVNASGLGARSLARDPHVRPMRGQVLHVANTIGLTEACAAHDGAVTYVYPFADHIVLGGTYEPDVHEEVTEPATLEAVRLRCEALLRSAGDSRWPRLAERPLRAVVGLRPARILHGGAETIRLEREETSAGPIIHNYGHGRAGVTLSWGCAQRVAELLDAR